MLNKISNWFDTLQEPYRFATFCYFVFGSFAPFGLAMLMYDARIAGWPIAFGALGMFHLVLFYALAFYRATRK